MDSGEYYDQESRGEGGQDHALVTALGMDGVEDPDRHCEDRQLEDRVGYGDADPSSRLGGIRCQRCVAVFYGLCDLQRYGKFDRTTPMVFCSHILSLSTP